MLRDANGVTLHEGDFVTIACLVRRIDGMGNVLAETVSSVSERTGHRPYIVIKANQAVKVNP